jgi:ribosome-binding protein aMBF1 (putative translation factor)
MAKTKDALQVVEEMVSDDAELQRIIAEETVNAQVARMIFDARSQAGLTQKELARLVGTTQSVIARLEDADYRGHSLTLVNRIAAALKLRIDIRMVALN